MDKIAANNHFVVLRKEIKKAKAMVSGNLIRKIAKIKQEIAKSTDDESKIKKLESNITAVYDEIKLLKTLDNYVIAKKATLEHNQQWKKLIADSKASVEDRLMARVITKNNVQKQVNKFRTDYKDCDEWINEYIEYREKKKIIEAKPKRHKKLDGKKDGKFLSHGAKKSSGAKGSSSQPKNNKVISKNIVKSAKIDAESEKEPVESLHPSWASKRKEKELLKAAFSGGLAPAKRITLDS